MNKNTAFNAHYYHFSEGDASLFAPTYRYKEGTDIIDYSKRIPSWTDRIIFRSTKLNDESGDDVL